MSDTTKEIWRPAHHTKLRWFVRPDQPPELQLAVQNRQTGVIRWETVPTVVEEPAAGKMG